MATRAHEIGDTLIEVLMSIVILSIVIVGAISLMAYGQASAQIALEHTQVRLSINSQSEMLRHLRDGYVKDPASQAGQTWSTLTAGSFASTTQSVYNPANCAVTNGKSAFYLEQNTTNGQVTVRTFDAGAQPVAAAQPGRGLWIEATRSTGVSPAFVDFQFRACWAGSGSTGRQQTVTSLRLYDPTH